MSIYKRITTLGIYLLLLTPPIHEIYVFILKIFEGYNHDSLYSGAKLCLSIRGRVKRVLSGGASGLMRYESRIVKQLGKKITGLFARLLLLFQARDLSTFLKKTSNPARQ